MSYQLHESTRTCQANVPLFKLQALVQLQAWQESLPSWGPSRPAIVPKKRGPRTAQTHSQSCLEAFHACRFALLLVNLVRVVATCGLKQTHPSVVVLRHAPLPTCLNSQEKHRKTLSSWMLQRHDLPAANTYDHADLQREIAANLNQEMQRTMQPPPCPSREYNSVWVTQSPLHVWGLARFSVLWLAAGGMCCANTLPTALTCTWIILLILIME